MKTLLGSKPETIDTGKYLRQCRAVLRWLKDGNARGTIEAATGLIV